VVFVRVSRRFSVVVQFILDELVPPIIRDSKWFMYLPMKLVLKDATHDFMSFKDAVFSMNEQEFGDLYKRIAHVATLQGETDLNAACVREILDDIDGQTVLEVGCGRGYLAGLLAKRGLVVTACDMLIGDEVVKNYPEVTFAQGNIESLPFPDNSFDVVVCTHTLEHVQDLPTAVAELRRVAKDRLLVVVPKQRPYRYGFNLHTHYFPYRWSIEGAFGYRPDTTVKDLGDWFYSEPMPLGTVS
jgi:ubiquinone/menaquinone biosynthesis C-methylase UbiE